MDFPRCADPAGTGIAHEKAYVEHLKSTGLVVVSFREFGSDEVLVTETLLAMQGGLDVIVQPAFGDKNWFGRVDVLRKVDRPSPAAGTLPHS
jgi:uncharacterized protein